MVAAAQSLQLFYGQFLPLGLSAPFIFLFLYGAYLLISTGILLVSLRTAGATISFSNDFPRGVFTIVMRDLIAVPLLVLIIISPLYGIIASFIIWLGLLRYFFQITWLQAFGAWIASGIIQILLIVLVIIPAFILL